MHYIIIGILLLFILMLYFKVANHYNIIDRPNERSSHTEITLRGGGIIFWFAALLYFVQNLESNFLFFTGISLVSVVSFWDDIKSLSNKLRISVHFFAITIIFLDLKIFDEVSVPYIPLLYFVCIGIINAFNFMDGINGMTGLYTFTVMGSLLYVNEKIQFFIDPVFIKYAMISNVVFLLFNFRKKAKCFAGDIGSIAISFWTIYILLKLIITTQNLVWILFLSVYLTDTFCTIVHRLYLKQNIFKPHRLHLYQVLSNEYRIDHRIVSLLYACIQLVIVYVIIQFQSQFSYWQMFLIALTPLITLYGCKFYLLNLKKLQL